MLNNLCWLESHRLQTSLIILYKIQTNLVHVDHNHLIHVHTRNLNFLIPQSRAQYHLTFYFPRTLRYCNGLPYQAKSSPSLNISQGYAGDITLVLRTQYVFIFKIALSLISELLSSPN